MRHEDVLRNNGYDFPEHRPVNRATFVRGYDKAKRSVASEREVLCPAGLCRILATEGYIIMGELDDSYLPFEMVVENPYGRYMVAPR
jgi:hypothetical protein